MRTCNGDVQAASNKLHVKEGRYYLIIDIDECCLVINYTQYGGSRNEGKKRQKKLFRYKRLAKDVIPILSQQKETKHSDCGCEAHRFRESQTRCGIR